MAETFKIGRSFEMPITIDEKHASVSHDHATITVDGEEWTLCDNDSTNGTFVEENGEFRRCYKLKISPDTWIRLGEQGHRGYYFKARRVLKPDDYREDFAMLGKKYKEMEESRAKLDSTRRSLKFLTPALLILGLGASFLPGIKENAMAVRVCFILPGLISPFIQEKLVGQLEKRVKRLQQEMICPKCRRTLGKDDIYNREHLYCKAH